MIMKSRMCVKLIDARRITMILSLRDIVCKGKGKEQRVKAQATGFKMQTPKVVY